MEKYTVNEMKIKTGVTVDMDEMDAKANEMGFSYNPETEHYEPSGKNFSKTVIANTVEETDSAEDVRLRLVISDDETGEEHINHVMQNLLVSGTNVEELDATMGSMMGGFSLEGIIQNLNASFMTVIEALRTQYDFDVMDVIELGNMITQSAIQEQYSEVEQMKGKIQAMMKMAEITRDNE